MRPIDRQIEYVDRIVGDFAGQISRAVLVAQGQIMQRLIELSADGLTLELSAEVERFLATIGTQFFEEMRRAGYDQIVSNFVGRFNGQLPMFYEAIDIVSQAQRVPLPPVRFDGDDLDLFIAQQRASIGLIDDVVQGIGARAKRNALFSVGGLPLKRVVSILTSDFAMLPNQASAVGTTAATVFFRVVTDRGFQIIEDDDPSLKVLYRFEGPLDKLTREFCRKILKAERTYTRQEIERMDNGMGNAFQTGGGFNCRHQWVIDSRVKK